ncbi:MAG: sigma-54-dependent Fis family transcriptional regulator [Sciscionella sp.]
MDSAPPAEGATTRRDATLPDDDAGLARTRIRFLTDEAIRADEVRSAILASWWRSRQFEVPADHIDLPYYADRDLDTPLIHGARPVLEHLGDELDGQPISLILTDRSGVVLTQRTGDPDLRRHLESVELVPGFSYSEQFVGTNGIGSALEGGGPMHVFGHEHYAENLEDLACAGVPIHHPISGKTIGAVDLTCWRRDAGALLIALARTTADQIRQALLSTSSIRELDLFRSYLQACRRTGGMVMALNDDVVMMNHYARQFLDPVDQTALLGHAAQALEEGRRTVATLDLPTGTRVQMHCRCVPGRDEAAIAGGVLHVKFIEKDASTAAESASSVPPMLPPGLVGSAPLWLRCCHDVDNSYGIGEWLVLAGEHGVGKLNLARCVHDKRDPAGRLRVIDAVRAPDSGWLGDAAQQLVTGEGGALVVRHVEALDGAAASDLAAALTELRGGIDDELPWVAITLTPGAETNPELEELLALFPRTVRVPPLRHHIEDLRELVPFFLDKLGYHGRLTCSPDAMQMLMRSDWPGNANQLYQVLKQVAQRRRRAGPIQPDDLSAEYHTVTRRPLNQLESLERDAIVRSLQDTHGNKVHAARVLGMSRATIYRKIHDYGIATPEHAH